MECSQSKEGEMKVALRFGENNKLVDDDVDDDDDADADDGTEMMAQR